MARASGLRRALGVQPRIADGVRGEALIVNSVAGPSVRTTSEGAVQSGYVPRWEAVIQMLVSVPGTEPFMCSPKRWMTRAKYPVAATSLPVTVEASDHASVRIEWDEVPEIDEWIACGHRVFTDPDSSHAELLAAMTAHQAAAAVHALSPAPSESRAARFDAPSARVLARTPGIAVGAMKSWRGEMLLSVAPPGGPRYGLRWKGKIQGERHAPEWSDVPVAIAEDGKVEVLWEKVPEVTSVATDTVSAYGDRLEAMLAAPSQWQAAPATAAAPASDPLHQLERLAELHDAGALTDSEFAAEKARVLDQM